MRRTLLLTVILLFIAGQFGCGDHRLATGYVYTPLGTSTDKRRGYYADPFSPEARAAQAEAPTPGIDAPRPIPSK